MENKEVKIAEGDFKSYRDVQDSGATNMFDVGVVSMLSGLSREKILDIMKNYGIYKGRWPNA